MVSQLEAGTSRSEEITPPEPQQATIARILFVEDDADVRNLHEMMSAIYMPAATVAFASNAEEALNQMANAEVPFDVIIVDRILIGEQDGFFVAQNAALLSPSSTVIMHTAQPEKVTDFHTPDDLARLNIFGVIGKMVSPDEFYIQIREMRQVSLQQERVLQPLH